MTESLYEPLPSLTTVNSSEVPYISLDEFLADESLEDKQHQTGESPFRQLCFARVCEWVSVSSLVVLIQKII